MDTKTLELLYGLQYEVTKREIRRGGFVTFKATCKVPLTEDILQDIQARLHWHPQGYGFYRVSHSVSDGINIYTWTSSNNCD